MERSDDAAPDIGMAAAPDGTAGGRSSLGRDRLGLVVTAALAVGLLTYTYLYAFTQHLFVFTEARNFLLRAFDLDLVRIFLLPVPDYVGTGRLTTHAAFEVMGAACGVEVACVNMAQILVLAVAAALVFVHTVQLSRSPALAALVAGLWVISAPVLGAAMWQSTLFDKLAVVASLAISGFWFWAFGRPRLSKTAMVAVGGVSVLLLGIAFNTKEITFYLPGVLIVLAFLRGLEGKGRLPRNLLTAALPLAYSGWFIGVALVRLDESYVSHVGSGSSLDTLGILLGQLLALGQTYALGAWGSWFDSAQALAFGLLVATAVSAAVLVIAAIRRSGLSLHRDTLVSFTPELYLGATFLGVMLLTTRTLHPSAYYLMIPYWALMTLVLLVVRRAALATSRPGLASAIVVSLLVLASVSATASHFGDGASVTRATLNSQRFMETGSMIRQVLQGRAVAHVDWRAIGPSDTEWYILRDETADPVPGPTLWPFIMEDAAQQPTLQPLGEGDAASLRAEAVAHPEPGRVLVVTGPLYELQLLVHEGQVLYEAPPSAVGSSGGASLR
jgi:hypothetical protein